MVHMNKQNTADLRCCIYCCSVPIDYILEHINVIGTVGTSKPCRLQICTHRLGNNSNMVATATFNLKKKRPCSLASHMLSLRLDLDQQSYISILLIFNLDLNGY